MLVIILGCGARVWANCCAVCLAGWWAWSYEAGWSSGRRGSDNPHSSPSYCRCQRGSPAWQAWPAAGAAWGAELSVEASTEDLSGRTGQVARHGCLHPQLQLRPQKALTWERRLCTLGEGWWRGSSFYMLFCSPSLTFFSLPPSLQWSYSYPFNPRFVTKLPDVSVHSSLGLVRVMERGFSDGNPCLGC